MDLKPEVDEVRLNAMANPGQQILKLFPAFVLVAIVGPVVVSFGCFGILVSIDVTALPWLCFLLVPLICLGGLLPLAVAIGRQIYQVAGQLEGGGVLIQALMQLSVVWVIIGNVVMFKLASALFL